MLNLLHRKIMADNIRWDSCTPLLRLFNTTLLALLIWILLTSSNPTVTLLGSGMATYVITARIWYLIILTIMRLFPPPPEKEEEEEEEKGKDEGEHYLLEKRKEKEEKEKK